MSAFIYIGKFFAGILIVLALAAPATASQTTTTAASPTTASPTTAPSTPSAADELAELQAVYENFERYLRAKAALYELPAVRAAAANFAYEQLAERYLRAKGAAKKRLAEQLAAKQAAQHFAAKEFYKFEPIDEKLKIESFYEILDALSAVRSLERKQKSAAAAAEEAAAAALAASDFAASAAALEGVIDAASIQRAQHIAQLLAKGAKERAASAAEYAANAAAAAASLREQVRAQYAKAAVFGLAMALIFIARFALLRLIARLDTNNDRLYSATKIINVFTTFIVALFFVFYFVENINYLISVLGFASAGVAIAMKDMFMSWLGWCVLQFGGSLRVGDRVRVAKNGSVYVGDIIDISLLKMTIYEDVTLTTYLENRRAGRLIYIPNNYIFTELISNYNHQALRTVWDGIDVTVTFTSDIELARELMLEAAQQHTAAIAAAAKTAISKMRSNFSMRSSGTEAKIFTDIVPYGVRLSLWYMAPSRETLRARSAVSAAVLERLLAAPNVQIAYPTQTLYKKEIS